ncbi:hypothetical protein Hanom_Chr16g01493171 [Helianthus anomalus]
MEYLFIYGVFLLLMSIIRNKILKSSNCESVPRIWTPSSKNVDKFSDHKKPRRHRECNHGTRDSHV